MIYSLDYLGGAKFGDVIVAEHPAGWGAGFFTYVDGFGDALPVIDALLATGRCPLIRVHLAWDDDHKFGTRYLKHVEREARRLRALLEKYPHVQWFVSPLCEHAEKESTWNKYAAIVTRELSGLRFTLVNTPLHGRGFVSRTHLNEYHGADSKPRGGRYGFSFDGKNCVDSNVEAYKKNYRDAVYWMLWNCQMNGRKNASAKKDPTPRPKRKAYPTSNQIDSWIALHGPRGSTSLPKAWIYKSHSDQHDDKPKGKDQKPVIVIEDLKAKYSKIEFRARNGQVIATSSGPQSYDLKRDDGTKIKQIGWRYYMPDWGYLLAEKAKRIQGDGLCEVFVNGRKVGVIQPAFRDGSFR